jgi:hypothetical protein
MNLKNRPIIVIGAHRSGTTWVGEMIALAPGIMYIHEPFNIDEPRIHPLKHWFQYVCDESPQQEQMEIERYIRGLIDFNLHGISDEFKMIRGPRDLLRFAKNSAGKTYLRPLIKDPIAVMSIEWLAHRFNAGVVALIRHPAAFVASLKVKKWTHAFEYFTSQKKLMEKLKPFSGQIELGINKPADIIEQGILLWNITYYMILEYEMKHPDWIFVRHEDLSLDPVNNYKSIYSKLGLHFSSGIEKKILQSTSSDKESRLMRNAKSNIHTWKNRLTEDEINRIKLGTAKISGHYYSENDW